MAKETKRKRGRPPKTEGESRGFGVVASAELIQKFDEVIKAKAEANGIPTPSRSAMVAKIIEGWIEANDK